MQRVEVRGCLPTAILLVLLVGLGVLAFMAGTAALVATLVLGAVAAAVGAIRRRLRPRRRGPIVTVDAEGPIVEVEIEPARRDSGPPSADG